jgi:predicted MFS family arabinose efflux permease
MALVFSIAVTLAGVVVGLIANSAEMRYFGWFLAVIGALGLASAVVLGTRRRR